MDIRKDTREYRRLLKANENVTLPFYAASELAALPAGWHLLTGDKTEDFGGGPSPFGFVIREGAVVARSSLPEVPRANR